MKRKTPAVRPTSRKDPLMSKVARQVGSMAGSLVHAGHALATSAAAFAESASTTKSKGPKSKGRKKVAKKTARKTNKSKMPKKTAAPISRKKKSARRGVR